MDGATGDPEIGFVVLAVAAAVYFLPWIVALARGHPNTTPIFLLTLFLGWTFVGWVVGLVWSATADRSGGE